ncbi:MAG: hypothetical protein JW395_3030 [Nitrospira sp.]|nr:hypothetical protein [Nitrospira sp.]
MKRYTSSLSPKGQITLPAEVRKRLKLKAKDQVAIEVDGDEVRIRPLVTGLEASYMAVPALNPPKTWKEIRKSVADERAQEYAKKFL